MPLHIAAQAVFEGLDSVPYLWTVLRIVPWVVGLYLIKAFFSGAKNGSERKMHGKVVLVTGGTSGVGAATVRALAQRGAQVVLLTQHSLSDPFIVEYIEDLRQETGNQLITAEQVDLASLHSVRKFATAWIDNAPPRRLDMVILCGNTMIPTSKSPSDMKTTGGGEAVELTWQVNYLSNFHLLSILSPALRAQPPDRDVRIIFGSCSSYLGGDLLHLTPSASSSSKPTKSTTSQPLAPPPTALSPANAYSTSKLALVTFALAFQKHLSSYSRPDSLPMNSKVLLVDPGICRTPGTRRWLTSGTLIGLFFYLLSYPFWWLVLKSPEMGSQGFLYAAMEERFSRMGSTGGTDGGILIKECKEREFLRKEVQDEALQKRLWEYSEKMIEEAEKRGALERARVKKMKEDEKEEEEAKKELRDYKEKVGKKDGRKEKDGSRRSKKT